MHGKEEAEIKNEALFSRNSISNTAYRKSSDTNTTTSASSSLAYLLLYSRCVWQKSVCIFR